MSDPSKFDPKALLERLQALEAENAKLKDASLQSPPRLVVVETEYKGHPMLEFHRGNARPFSMGVKKLEAIQEGWDEVERFLKKHGSAENSEQI
jgi:allophanate hydrolase subunit 1